MAARVQVVVEAKDATAGVFRALTSQLGAFGGLVEELTTKNVNWGNVAQMATQMVINGIKDSIKVTTEYAQDVRDLALASGQGAEASSRMLQVLDDYQLTAEDAATATKALTREGLAPTIETIADISREYLGLNNAQERNELLQKKLGRASKEWLNLMQQGPDAIMAMNDAVSDGLILTDANVLAAEEYRLALDEWNDSVMALKVSIGNQLLPVLTNLMNRDVDQAILAGANATGVAGVAVDALADAYASNLTPATDEQIRAWREGEQATDALTLSQKELEAAEKAAAEAAKATDAVNKGFLTTLSSVKSQIDTYREGVAAAKEELAAGSITTDEYRAKVEGLGSAYEATKNKIILSIVEMKLASDGWTDDEISAYLQIGQKLGQFDAKMVTTTESYITQANKIVEGTTAMEGPILHVGERAADAGEDFGIMREGAQNLGESIRSSLTPAVSGLKSALNGLPASKTINVDVFIRTHGSLPAGIHNTTPGTGQNQAEQWVANQQGGHQMGGEVFAGQPTWIGEAGREPFIPSQNGRILGHAESLHALQMAGGGGGGKFGPFYGPVTIQTGIDGADGLMSMR